MGNKRRPIMTNKIYTVCCGLILLACCSEREDILAERVVVLSPPPPLYPRTTSAALILKKRVLPHKREEYHARFLNGREMTFTVEAPAHYQVGDVISLPLE